MNFFYQKQIMEYLKNDYAKIKRVSASYITQLVAKGRLITSKNKFGRVMIIDCPQNDAVFKKVNNQKQIQNGKSESNSNRKCR